MIAPVGTVNFGDAGVRVSDNFNVAARFVINVDNLAVKGEIKGGPKDEVKIAPLTTETKDNTAADAVRDATLQRASDRPSVISVEVLGYGGGDGETQRTRRKRSPSRSAQPGCRPMIRRVRSSSSASGRLRLSRHGSCHPMSVVSFRRSSGVIRRGRKLRARMIMLSAWSGIGKTIAASFWRDHGISGSL